MRTSFVGLVSPRADSYWFGGTHYLQHFLGAIASLPQEERPSFRDVWWGQAPPIDPFADVRHLIAGTAELRLPNTLLARLGRQVSRLRAGRRDRSLADLFERAGIGLLFPCLPCDNCGVPLVFWVTDLQYFHLPHYYSEARLRWFEEHNRRNGEIASRVMVSSRSVLDDVERFLPSLAPKTRVIKMCSVPTAEWWQIEPDVVARSLGLPSRYFMISNQVCAHKNHATVFEALSILRSRGQIVNVVCTGRNEDYRDPGFFARLLAEVEEKGLAGQVRFLGALPRAEQIAVMRGAVAVLQPSEFEGFGLAVADAKALGKRVLASDLPVHYEHAHPEITYLPVKDASAWATAMAAADRQTASPWSAGAEQQAIARNRLESREIGRDAVALFEGLTS